MKTRDDFFNDWLNSDNVIKTNDNEYITQCTQYSIKFTKVAILDYYFKNYDTKNNY